MILMIIFRQICNARCAKWRMQVEEGSGMTEAAFIKWIGEEFGVVDLLNVRQQVCP